MKAVGVPDDTFADKGNHQTPGRADHQLARIDGSLY